MYRDWVEKEIDQNPREFDDFQKGQGIIEVREKFLKWFESEEGQRKFVKMSGGDGSSGNEALKEKGVVSAANADVTAEELERRKERDAERDSRKGKLVIVPIAVPGCGAFDFLDAYFIVPYNS